MDSPTYEYVKIQGNKEASKRSREMVWIMQHTLNGVVEQRLD
jgi:hypothetical protein